MRVADNDKKSMSPSDGNVESLRAAEEAECVVKIDINKRISRPNLTLKQRQNMMHSDGSNHIKGFSHTKLIPLAD